MYFPYKMFKKDNCREEYYNYMKCFKKHNNNCETVIITYLECLDKNKIKHVDYFEKESKK